MRFVLVCLLAVLLAVGAALRYPAPPRAALEYRTAPFVTIGVLLAATVVTEGLWRRRPIDGARRRGTTFGMAAGTLWIGEIAFNNFIAPTTLSIHTRDVVDDLVWAAVAVVLLLAACRQSAREGTWAGGVSAGVWAGWASGWLACLAGLAVVALWMPFLVSDPANTQEFAERGPASGALDIVTYVAAQTMAGALLHLIVLGAGMGLVLGLLGASAGRVFRRRRLRPRPAPSP